MPSNQITALSKQTALISEEIARTREICQRSLALLRESAPSTFLGKRLDPLPQQEQGARDGSTSSI